MDGDDMAFPIIAFRPLAGGRETFGFVSGEEELRRAGRGEIRKAALVGMALVDSAGRAWTIRGVKALRRRTPLWQCALMTIFPQWDDIEYEVDLSLEAQPPVTFEALQVRVCRSIDQNPDEWADDEAMAGEAGPPVTLKQLMQAAKDAVAGSTDIETMRIAVHGALP